MPKPYKRNHPFTDNNTGKEVYLYLIRDSDGMYIVSESKKYESVYEVKLSDLSEVRSNKVSIIQLKPKMLTDGEKSDKQAMNEFFDKVGLKIPFNCMECNTPLYAFTKPAKRAVSAHCLPKAHFESIKTNEANIIYLGASFIGCPCDCHTRYDSNVDARIKMNVYKIALERFEILKPLLTPIELKRAYTYLNIQWK